MRVGAGNFDGGVRVAGFLSGGAVPSSRRGTSYGGLVAVHDFYAILCSLAGVSTYDPLAAAAGLPPVDGMDLSVELLGSPAAAAALNGNAPSRPIRRSELAIGTNDVEMGFVEGMFYEPQEEDTSGIAAVGGGKSTPPLYKLLLGVVNQDAHSGPLSPNNTENATLSFWGGNPQRPWVADAFARDCGAGGCLYDVRADPGEAHDLSKAPPGNESAAAMAQVLEYMHRRIEAYRGTALLRVPGERDPAACVAAMGRGGFWGPWSTGTVALSPPAIVPHRTRDPVAPIISELHGVTAGSVAEARRGI